MDTKNTLNNVGKSLERMTPAAESLKAFGKGTCNTAIDLCNGNRIGDEIKRLGMAVLSGPLELPAGALRGCGALLKKDVIGAAKEFSSGFSNTCYRVIEAGTSPARLATAGIKQGGRAAITVAKTPVTVPLAAYRKGNEWLERASGWLFADNMIASANKSAASGSGGAPAPPPPPGSGAAASSST